jgi:hypothetical protein
MRFLITLAALAFPLCALAQNIGPSGGGGGGSTTPTVPSLTTVLGTLTVSTSSVAISTLTLSPNSASFVMPPPNKQVCITNLLTSPNIAYVTLLGGVATGGVSTNGLAFEPGVARCRYLTGTTVPQIISDGVSYVSITE